MASSRHGVAQASRLVARAVRSPKAPRASFRLSQNICRVAFPLAASRRPFSACAAMRKGIMPDGAASAKEPPKMETKYTVAELSDAEYHEIADEYLDNALARFEHLQDTKGDLDVEFSSGVMTISIPDKGIYVINKQPPNKQIWLSSPISGPKRYDWCLVSEGQGDKEGTGAGYWMYSRDSSSLDELILEEMGVDLQGLVDS